MGGAGNIRFDAGLFRTQAFQRTAAAALLSAIILALYLPTLPFPFYFDDITDIAENPSIRVTSLRPGELLRATGETHNVSFRRPIAFYTFALNFFAGGLDPSGYRIVNILIHIANTVLVWLLARRLLGTVPGRRPGEAVPLLVAALWALHPVQTNAVVYVVQRMTSLCTFFYLASFLAYLRGRDLRAPLWYALALTLLALAAGTKEIAYTLPGLVVLYEIAFTPGVRRWIAGRPLAVPLALGGAALLFLLAVAIFAGEYAEKGYTWQQRLFTEARVVANYLSLLAVPHPARLLFDYSGQPLSTGILSPVTTLPSVLLHAALLGLGGGLLVRRPLYGFCLLGFYLHLLIESTVIPVEIAFEHRLYLPSVFPILGLGALGRAVYERSARGTPGPRAAVALLVVATALSAWWTRERLEVWRDPLSFWSDVAAKNPLNSRAPGSLGIAARRRGDLAAARTHFRRAIELSPADARNWLNLGLVESDSGNGELAVSLIEKAYVQGLHHPFVFMNLGLIHNRLGKLAEAIADFDRALSYDPRLPEANFLIGSTYQKMGDLPKAKEHLQRELALNPGHRESALLLRSIDRGGAPPPGDWKPVPSGGGSPGAR